MSLHLVICKHHETTNRSSTPGLESIVAKREVSKISPSPKPDDRTNPITTHYKRHNSTLRVPPIDSFWEVFYLREVRPIRTPNNSLHLALWFPFHKVDFVEPPCTLAGETDKPLLDPHHSNAEWGLAVRRPTDGVLIIPTI